MLFAESRYDAIIVGSGPNGLAAAITFAQAGLSTVVLEAKSTIGGGMRSAELTLPGFIHDICSAVHPLGVASPFFRSLPLKSYGLDWIFPELPLAHPLEADKAVTLEHSLEATCQHLDTDGPAYLKLMQPLVSHWNELAPDLLAPLHWPAYPLELLRFGLKGMQPATKLAKKLFIRQEAQALFAGLAAHAIMPLDKSFTSAFALILAALGHRIGWPIPRGGSNSIADALAALLRNLGGEIITEMPVLSLDQLPPARAILLDVTPKQLLQIAGDRLPKCYRKRLKRYRYGPGVFKLDWALNTPIPWKAEACSRAGTVHLGGTLEQIAASERQVWEGVHPEKNYMIVTQPSLFDPSRAPLGCHTAWAYCHVPNGSRVDLTNHLEEQINQMAPGFKDCILARHAMSTQDLEKYNANYIGGDINGGVQDIYQLFTRPILSLDPYATPLPNVYLCSSSTPPGGGVHGMCGYHAAQSALKRIFHKGNQ